MTELIWDGKYKDDAKSGKRIKTAPPPPGAKVPQEKRNPDTLLELTVLMPPTLEL